MLDVAKTKEELQYALETGWDRDAAIRHSLEVINQLELNILEAKRAIFKMINQFQLPTTIDSSNELYMCDYCESALEAAFTVLGIEEDYIKLSDYCKMLVDNDKKILAIKRPDEEYYGLTADMHYSYFKEAYDVHKRVLEDDKYKCYFTKADNADYWCE